MSSISLEKISGIPISLDQAGQLLLDADLLVEETIYRSLDELAVVAMQPETCRGIHIPAYWMFNGVCHQSDHFILSQLPLRYELTYLPARRLGSEFIKTHGHRHFPEAKSGLQYAEICEVLFGTAHFLFQLPRESPPGVAAVFYIEAHPGDKVLFPPGLDHCTINPSDAPLLFSDVVARGVRGDYSYFKEHQGAAYWEVEGPAFIPNPHYGDVPPIEKRPVHCYPQLNLTNETPLYQAFVETQGKDWQFLTDPSLFWSTFPDLIESFSAK